MSVKFGYFLSSEEFSPRELVRQARLAEEAGFEALWISDHYHPWTEEQGESGFVWATIGALSQAVDLPITTAVTCPLVRIHPAIIAQAAATSQVLAEGRFRLGVGTGEALNEHVTGARWPGASERLEMLEEAVLIIKRLFTGEQVTHRGTHYRVETARLYTIPDTPPPIYMSAFGPKSLKLATRIADGYINISPEAGVIEKYREAGGKGPALGGTKVCWAPDEQTGAETIRRIWPNELIPGEAGQILPNPRQFQQLSQLVTVDEVRKQRACGPDPQRHFEVLKQYVDAGYDEVYVNQIGPDQDAFFDFYAKEVLPELRRHAESRQ
ncbi:TIGR03557 family F420-dependent LLM class oxidoreductase [Bailinhaonella thermotolerans]|uniref:TIGR03557 family F420-dependent LLM class oxidoreductase n=1 Tax=Bailinhaonella thermotolerans TaxID=1070861 RepID=A0A3A4A7Z2_9ACTN|nr:TIGR03557 family F420-dependent LLM class oxidoreductase [Bailinhaonella thermotolerans]